MILDTLRDNPTIGIVSSFGSPIVAWLDLLNPLGTFISICIGIAIGLVTLSLKYREWKSK